MVSLRCIRATTDALQKLGFQDYEVNLGEINLIDTITSDQISQIRSALLLFGFEIIENKKNSLVQQIKSQIIDIIYHSEEPLVNNLSVYLSQQLHHEYTYLANVFSDHEGKTIAKFYICHKIERVKELLTSRKLSLTEIADKMNYSSISHLSSQFKKVTGLTPSNFQKSGDRQPSPIDKIC